jgi:hypothetical protein
MQCSNEFINLNYFSSSYDVYFFRKTNIYSKCNPAISNDFYAQKKQEITSNILQLNVIFYEKLNILDPSKQNLRYYNKALMVIYVMPLFAHKKFPLIILRRIIPFVTIV